jgi:MFS family permease
MGFFTDAYDLFIIGVVISILKDEWHPFPWAVGLVTSTALLAAAFGAVIFGRVADMLGRQRIYGYEVLVLAAGANRVGIFARHLVADRSPDHSWRRHWRRLSGQRCADAMQAAGLVLPWSSRLPGTFAVPCRWLIGGKGNNENRSNCPFNGKRSA